MSQGCSFCGIDEFVTRSLRVLATSSTRVAAREASRRTAPNLAGNRYRCRHCRARWASPLP
jgi:hypothetical protein